MSCLILCEGACREKEVLKIFYGKLAKIFPINSILHELIPAGIITTDDMDDISHMPRQKDKASFILNKIDRSLEADVKNSFYTLLDAMEECGNDDVRDIVKDIRRTLMTGELISTNNCIHGVTGHICSDYSQLHTDVYELTMVFLASVFMHNSIIIMKFYKFYLFPDELMSHKFH